MNGAAAHYLPRSRNRPLPTIQIHYDGWLSLPEDARQHLALVTGSRLEVELADGMIMLRPARQDTETIAAEPSVLAEPEPMGSAAELAEEPAAPKRGPGRPRKTVAQNLSPRIKVGGRRKSDSPDQQV